MKKLIFLMTFWIGGAWALQCGDTVSGVVNLTANLHCIDQTGLIVGADNTIINLNGFEILCTGSGFDGTCQGQTGGSIAGLPVGIFSDHHSHVTVRGVGFVVGFAFGIELRGGTGLMVQEVFMSSGKLAVPLDQNHRAVAIGVWIRDVACSALSGRAGVSARVFQNSIAGHVTGILLSNSHCVLVDRNSVGANTAEAGNAHGIAIAGGGDNTIFFNDASGNGLNRPFDSGIYLVDDVIGDAIVPTVNNVIAQNTVNSNCGNGISTGTHADNNNIFQNTAKFNGESTDNGKCELTRFGAFHDLAGLGGTGNTWNDNNVCRTQAGNVPAGVCNPWE
jgi:hypothetical protein